MKFFKTGGTDEVGADQVVEYQVPKTHISMTPTTAQQPWLITMPSLPHITCYWTFSASVQYSNHRLPLLGESMFTQL